jgi:hypothetical protein
MKEIRHVAGSSTSFLPERNKTKQKEGGILDIRFARTLGKSSVLLLHFSS